MFWPFNLFKDNSPKAWEIELLAKALGGLPEDEFDHYVREIQAGLLASRRVSNEPMPNSVSYWFNADVSGKFELRMGRDFSVRGITVWDRYTTQKIELVLFCFKGLLDGYATPATSKFDPDISTVSTANWYRVYEDFDAFEPIRHLLGDATDLVNPADVFDLEIGGLKLYQLLDIGDGDFVGIDDKGLVYECFHDPFEIRRSTEKLRDVLNKYLNA